MKERVMIDLGEKLLVFPEIYVKYGGTRWKSGIAYRNIHIFAPWLDDSEYAYLVDGESMRSSDPDDSTIYVEVTLVSAGSGYITVDVEYLAGLKFSNIAISRRYGERLYLSGSIENVIDSDEICVYFSRPGDTGIRNLKSDTSDYLYFNGTSGSYDLGVNNRYIEFERAGYHWLQIWDVDGNCETPITKRAKWLMNIVLPRFQYQLIFDLDNPDIVDTAWRLEAEYAKFEAAGGWKITHEDPDCFPLIQGLYGGVDETPQSGWLSLGVEFGESPCAPLPYYLCPFPTPQTQYWRGECSCSEFKNTLQPLGIPCWHLIAAKAWYSGETPWSKYIQCP